MQCVAEIDCLRDVQALLADAGGHQRVEAPRPELRQHRLLLLLRHALLPAALLAAGALADEHPARTPRCRVLGAVCDACRDFPTRGDVPPPYSLHAMSAGEEPRPSLTWTWRKGRQLVKARL